MKDSDLARHRTQCTVCRHPNLEDIEQEWLSWGHPASIARQYGLSRDSLYRHAGAVCLFAKRQKNLKGALERIIERGDLASISGSTIIAAIKAYPAVCAREAEARKEALSAQEPVEVLPKKEPERDPGDGGAPASPASEASVTPVKNQVPQEVPQVMQTNSLQ